MIVVVRYETLGGNVVTKRFPTWEEAQAFADHKQDQSGIQWVDVEEATK